MDDLRLYISGNKDLLEEESLPRGDAERFLARLTEADEGSGSRKIHFHASVHRRSIPVWRMLAVPAAAVILVVFSMRIFTETLSEEDSLGKIYSSYRVQLMELSSEIVALSESDEDACMYSVVIDGIDFEAIPMSEILPSELTEREKAEIMERYYSAKLDGIKRLRNILAEAKQ